jgi:hypothetical protein
MGIKTKVRWEVEVILLAHGGFQFVVHCHIGDEQLPSYYSSVEYGDPRQAELAGVIMAQMHKSHCERFVKEGLLNGH